MCIIIKKIYDNTPNKLYSGIFLNGVKIFKIEMQEKYTHEFLMLAKFKRRPVVFSLFF